MKLFAVERLKKLFAGWKRRSRSSGSNCKRLWSDWGSSSSRLRVELLIVPRSASEGGPYLSLWGATGKRKLRRRGNARWNLDGSRNTSGNDRQAAGGVADAAGGKRHDCD